LGRRAKYHRQQDLFVEPFDFAWAPWDGPTLNADFRGGEID
jgi:hypothetical protein